MKQIVAIDPGLNACGVAVLNEHGYITCAELVRNEYGPGDPLPDRWEGAALAVGAWLATHTQDDGDLNRILVIEMPKVYGAGQQVGDQNDIVNLAGVVASLCVLGHYSSRRTLYPRDWKGTIDPDVFIEDRIKPRLFPNELEAIRLPTAKSLQHNVFDAVGIGLHVVGRLEPKRVIAR